MTSPADPAARAPHQPALADRVAQLLAADSESNADSSMGSALRFGFGEFQLALGMIAVFCVCTGALMAAWAYLPGLFGWHSSAIVSGSMAPTIERGDVVVFGLDPSDDLLGPGSVIRFDPGNGRPVVHRIVGFDPERRQYVTKGDANDSNDSGGVPTTGVIGVGALLVPLVGWPIVWLAEGNWPAVAGLCIGVAALLLAARSTVVSSVAAPNRVGFGPLVAGESTAEDGLIPRELRIRLGVRQVADDG